MEYLFLIAILLFSIVIHEVSHGFVAYAFGDPTAKDAGRLTLNPIPHIDPFGTVLLPLIMAIPAFFGASPVIFGWAKPVPFNPLYFRKVRLATALVAVAGVAANFFMAAVFSLAIRFLMPHLALVLGTGVAAPLGDMLAFIVRINLLLGIFNVVPIPPLDGSKILFSILPRGFEGVQRFFEQYGILLLIIFIFFFIGLLGFLVEQVFQFLTGFLSLR